METSQEGAVKPCVIELHKLDKEVVKEEQISRRRSGGGLVM